MPYVLVRHKVEDYAKWKPLFDAHASARAAAGSKGGQVLLSSDDPNEVLVLLEWDDLKNARRFFQSPGLRDKMREAGLAGRPEIIFLDEADRPSA